MMRVIFSLCETEREKHGEKRPRIQKRKTEIAFTTESDE